MGKILLWADLHLEHQKIILYSNRPFENAEDMTKKLLQNWRETVKKNDVIFNLGDLSFDRDKERLQKTIRNLPGYKVLIFGNHDRKKSYKWWSDIGFNEVYKYPIIFQDKYILSHEPVQYGVGNDGYINIHGHIHNNFCMLNEYYVNVSIEIIDYKPINFDVIKKKFEDGE